MPFKLTLLETGPKQLIFRVYMTIATLSKINMTKNEIYVIEITGQVEWFVQSSNLHKFKIYFLPEKPN